MERKSNKQQKLHIKRDDMVKVIAGDEKGKKGRVIRINTETQRATVEGVNIVTKHKKSRAANQPGSILKEEAPIHISNLMLVDGDGNATRVGRRANDKGKLVRFSKKSNAEIKG
jgi:large subunit ribosomal protein L24